MADIYCKIPHFLVYKGLNSTNFVRIRFSQSEESNYVILIPFELKRINTATLCLENWT